MEPNCALLVRGVIEKCVTLTTEEMQNLSNENKIRYGYPAAAGKLYRG